MKECEVCLEPINDWAANCCSPCFRDIISPICDGEPIRLHRDPMGKEQEDAEPEVQITSADWF